MYYLINIILFVCHKNNVFYNIISINLLFTLMSLSDLSYADITTDFVKTQTRTGFMKSKKCFFPRLTKVTSMKDLYTNKDSLLNFSPFGQRSIQIKEKASSIVKELLDKKYSFKPKNTTYRHKQIENLIPMNNYHLGFLQEIVKKTDKPNVIGEKVLNNCFGGEKNKEKVYEKFKKLIKVKMYKKADLRCPLKNMNKNSIRLKDFDEFRSVRPIYIKSRNVFRSINHSKSNISYKLSFDEKMKNTLLDLHNTVDKLMQTKIDFGKKKKSLMGYFYDI